MGKGKGEYEQRSGRAIREVILRMHKKGWKLGLVSTFSMAPSWMNKQNKDIAKSVACSPFVFVKSYQR